MTQISLSPAQQRARLSAEQEAATAQERLLADLHLPQQPEEAGGEVGRLTAAIAQLEEEHQRDQERELALRRRKEELQNRIRLARFDDDQSLLFAVAAEKGLALLEPVHREAQERRQNTNEWFSRRYQERSEAWRRYEAARSELTNRREPPYEERQSELIAEIRRLVGGDSP